MFEFAAVLAHTIRIVIIRTGNLAVMIRSEAIPLGAIQRIKFDSMDPVDRLSWPYCRNSVSSSDHTNKDISGQSQPPDTCIP